MNGPHTTFVCWRHHNNVKLQLLLFSVFLCGQSQLSDHVMHTSTIQNYTTSNIRLNRNIFTAQKKGKQVDCWLQIKRQWCLRRAQCAHFENIRRRRAWKLLLTIPQTCGSTRTSFCIHICKRMRNFFGVPTREKTHVPFIMMFSLNFSIHRLMFFVLSGFLFLDTNCASVCTTHEMYWCRFYMSSAWLCCRCCCCCLFSTAWLDASPVSSFSSKKIKSTEQMPLFRANPIVPLCNVYRKLHFEDHKHTRYGGCVRWFFFCCSLFYKFFDSCIVSCAPFITYNMGCSSGKSKN